MLAKIIAIKNVGNFRHCTAGGDTAFRKLNLVHGDNGRGKSTLCSILRSLRSNEAKLIIERKTLNGDGDPHVHIRLDAGSAEFKNGKWQAASPKIEIFDAEFVTANVFSGDAITHDHKRNLCTVVLGEEGVKLADRCVTLDLDEREAIKALATAESSVKALINAKGVTVDEFIGLAEDLDIDQKLERKKAELQVIKDAATIRGKPSLSHVSIEAIPINLVSVLSKKLDDVSRNAEDRIKQHIDAHRMGQRGENWLSEGLGYIVDEKCPMCGQHTSSSTLLPLLRGFFSEAYSDFKQDISTVASAAAAVSNDAAMVSAQTPLAANLRLIEFWKQYAELREPALSFEDRVQPAAKTLRAALDPLLQQKMATPLECIELAPKDLVALADWSKLREEAVAYNSEVDAFNQGVAAVKKGAESKSSAAIEQELAVLQARRARHTDAGRAAVETHKTATDDKKRIETEKQAAKDKLAEYNEKVIDAYRQSVNEMLERFGAAFKLAKVKIEYQGGKPRAGYAFEIRGVEVDPGNEKTEGVPCFRNTLSSGDRSTLAFAFFMAQVGGRSDLNDLVVVLDDPFTSLDEFRQRWTCYAIRQLAEKAKQVMVLSHCLEFLRLIESNCAGVPLKALRIAFVGAGDSELVEFDLKTAAAGNVDKNVMTLKEYLYAESEDSLAAIRAIRPALENYMRSVAPDDCPAGEGGWLGSFLGQVTAADSSSPLAIFKAQYADFDFLNENTKAYHHDPDTAPRINEPELRTWVRMCLKAIHRLPAA